MFPRSIEPVFRSTTFSWVKLREQIDWDKVSQIIPGLYLSSLPINKAPCGRKPRFTNTVAQLCEFVKAHDPDFVLKLMVSAVEKNELKGVGFCGTETITEEELEEAGVERDVLEICDHDLVNAKLNLDDAVKELKKMHEFIQSKRAVVVHCKGGQQRSAMVCVCYLAAFVKKPGTDRNYSVEEAIEHVKSKRKQIAIYLGKFIRAKQITNTILNVEEELPRISVCDNLASFWQKHKKVATATLMTGTALAATAVCRMMCG